MFLEIKRLLSQQQVERIRESLSRCQFAPGSITAGKVVAAQKSSLELAEFKPKKDLGTLIKAALMINDEFKSFALPKIMLDPEFVRYDSGSQYGDHIDSAIFNIHAPNALRTDLAATIFLSDPADYTGGELIVYEEQRECVIKCDSGDAVIYPANSIHRVNPVQCGCRLVAVTWIQSYVKDSNHRNVLHDLNKAANDISQCDVHAHTLLLLGHLYNNMLRMWSDL